MRSFNTQMTAITKVIARAKVIGLLGLAFVSILNIGPVAYGQSDQDKRLETIKKSEQDERNKAKALAQERDALSLEVKKLKSELVKQSNRIEGLAYDENVISTRLDKLEYQRQAARLDLDAGEASNTELLAALQRLQIDPPPIWLLEGEELERTLHAAHLMQGLKKTLDQQAEALTQKLSQFNRIENDIVTEQTRLAENRSQITQEQAKLSQLVAQKNKSAKDIDAQRQAAIDRAQTLASQAADIEALIASLESAVANITPRLKPGRDAITQPNARSSAPNIPLILPDGVKPFSQAKGLLRLPAQGQLNRDKDTSAVDDSQGLKLITQNGTQVISPYAGRVEFAGPFKNYNNVVILNMGEGYFILLTGLDEIFAQTGEVLQTGEPVGRMSIESPTRPELYIEFRRNGTSVNPTPWFGTNFASLN